MTIVVMMMTMITVGFIINVFKIFDEIKENEMSEACSMPDDKCIGLHSFGWNI